MKVAHVLPILGMLLILAACGGSRMSASAPTTNPAMSEIAAMEATTPPVAGSALEQSNIQSDTEQNQTAQQDLQRMVIKNADLSLQVANIPDAEVSVRNTVAQLGGYVIKAETSSNNDYLSSLIMFRVPATRFDEALSGVQGLAKQVISRSITGDDVTDEFVDVESRLRNLEATRDRLQSFLDRATSVEDALKVNQSLSDIQGQIEQLKGRQQYIKQSVAFSTITVRMSPVPTVTPILQKDAWEPIQVARDALRSLVIFGQGLLSLIIVVLVWAPVWLPLGLLGRWAYRRRFNKATQSAV